MKYPLILIFLICSYITKAQNLVPDSSFEDFVNCPTTFGQIICPLTPTPPFPQTLKHWISPCFNSPDYFNGCSTDQYSTVPNNFYGYKPAKTGNGYVGIVAYSGYIANPSGSYREYVETELKSPLKAAKKYHVSFYVNYCAISNAGTNVVAVKTMGVAFSPTQVTSPSWPLSLSHVDAGTSSGSYLDNAAGWTKVSCEYMATGGEKHLVIGCFNTGAVPDIKQITPPTQNPSDPIFSYYFIEDVTVTEQAAPSCDTLLTSQTITSCSDTPVVLKPTVTATGYEWNTGATSASISVNTVGIYWRKAVNDCSLYVDSFIIKSQDTILHLLQDTSLCEPISFTLKTTIENASYTWNTGATTAEIKITAPGKYWCITSKNCEIIIDSFDVHNKALFNFIDLGNNKTICKDAMQSIGNIYPGAISYNWNTGANACCITPHQSGMYSVEIDNGCSILTDSIHLEVLDCDNCLFIPSAFTPNNDGKNDNFGPLSRCPISAYGLSIYNRWGECVFRTPDINKKWNGTYKGIDAELGTYYYEISYVITGNKKSVLTKGDIILIR